MSKTNRYVKCKKSAKLGVIFFLMFFANMAISFAQSPQKENPMVLREVGMWKFNAEENVVTPYFPCSLVTNYCKERNIKEEGFYKAYFPDGFVLTLSLQGKILEHYYNPSPNNMSALLENWDAYENSDFKDVGEERRKKILTRKNDLKDFVEKKLLGINDLYLGNYELAIKKSTSLIIRLDPKGAGIGVSIEIGQDKTPFVAEVMKSSPADKAGLKVGDKIMKVDGQSVVGWDLESIAQKILGEKGTSVTLTIQREGKKKPMDISILRDTLYGESEMASAYKKLLPSAFALRALAKRELGKKEEFFSDAERAYSLDPNNNWARRAMAFLHIEKGNFDEALKVLPKKRDVIEMAIEIIISAKQGDIKKASDIYCQLLEDFSDTKNEFIKRNMSFARDSLRLYAETRLKSAKDYEEKGQYKEAIKEYKEYLKFADEKEAKNIRNHIATLMAKFPHFFALTEDARKFVIRAEAYTSEGDFEKAILEYKKAISIQPFFPAIYKALALNYAKLKNYKQAIKNMQIYLELYPDAPDARAAKDEIYRWEALMEKESNK